MFKTILVPLDGSRPARRALPYAAYLVRAVTGKLILFRAFSRRAPDRESKPDPDAILQEDWLADRLVEEGVPTTALAGEGDAAPSIMRAVADLRADLVVMSTHGRGGLGRVIHGSIADHLLRHSPVPVLVVTPKCDREWVRGRPMRILVPLDGSALAEEAIRPALELARAFPVELWLLRTVEERLAIDALGFAYAEPVSNADLGSARQHLEQAAAIFRQSGHHVRVAVEAGRPDEMIERLAEREAVDLVVMATHGTGGLGRLLLERMATVVTAGRVPLHLGTVAAAAIRRLAVPVLLVCPAPVSQVGTPAPADAAPTAPARMPAR